MGSPPMTPELAYSLLAPKLSSEELAALDVIYEEWLACRQELSSLRMVEAMAHANNQGPPFGPGKWLRRAE